jgi:cell wall-associated NlpC family hydrolase
VAVAFAKAQLGEPYVWAATGPNSWDCSGLTMKAWAAAGVKIPRVASDQYYFTKRVALANLLPGDLVFSSNSSGIYHVAIYVGNSQVIHAPQTGDVVRYRSLYTMTNLMPSGGRVSS